VKVILNPRWLLINDGFTRKGTSLTSNQRVSEVVAALQQGARCSLPAYKLLLVQYMRGAWSATTLPFVSCPEL
jgi:hypothetical protein